MEAGLIDTVDNIPLKKAVIKLINTHPASIAVIQGLLKHYNEKLASAAVEPTPLHHKKPKGHSEATTVEAELVNISVQMPARKRLTINFTATHLLFMNMKTVNTEYSYTFEELKIGACLPTPEKTQIGYTFVLFFKNESLDPIVFNIVEDGKLTLNRPGQKEQLLNSNSDKVISQLFTEKSVEIIVPSKDVYLASGLFQGAGQPVSERSYASCHWKNKDGYLFFMPQGVLFGFKKPTVFFPVESIASIAIGYVTRLTFDLSIRLKEKKLAYGASGGLNIPRFRPGWDGETVSFEFTMIEHSEYRAINAYIEKLSINDSSMSEARRAPVLKSIASSTPSDNDKEDQPGTARMMEEDDDEENDHDFVPSDNGDEPLEYDSDASSDQEDDDDNEYHSGEDVDELDEMNETESINESI